MIKILFFALLLAASPAYAQLDYRTAGTGSGSGTTVNDKTCGPGEAFVAFLAPDFNCGAISGGSGAPTNATYWVKDAHDDLSDEIPLSSINGAVISTAGVPSAYAGASCTNQAIRALDANLAATCASITSNFLNITTTTCSGQFVRTISSGAIGGCEAIAESDVPNLSASKITSGTLATARGGTNSDSSAASGIAHVSSGTWSYSAVIESDITLSDNTTNNVSTSKHGFVPKLPNDSTKFLNGVGAFATPSGGSDPWTFITSSADASQASSATLTDVTGMSFSAGANTNYIIECWIIAQHDATTNGIYFVWNTPASPNHIFLTYFAATTSTGGAGMSYSIADDTTGGHTGSVHSSGTNIMHKITALFRNGANAGTTQLRFAPETNSNITVRQNSVCGYRSY